MGPARLSDAAPFAHHRDADHQRPKRTARQIASTNTREPTTPINDLATILLMCGPHMPGRGSGAPYAGGRLGPAGGSALACRASGPDGEGHGQARAGRNLLLCNRSHLRRRIDSRAPAVRTDGHDGRTFPTSCSTGRGLQLSRVCAADFSSRGERFVSGSEPKCWLALSPAAGRECVRGSRHSPERCFA